MNEHINTRTATASPVKRATEAQASNDKRFAERIFARGGR
jgi:hypothetical protein